MRKVIEDLSGCVPAAFLVGLAVTRAAVDADIAPHPLRALKSGALSFTQACQLEVLRDERLLDLIGFALIGALAAHQRHTAGFEALRISQLLAVGPYLTARTAPQELIWACARAIEDVTADPRVKERERARRWWPSRRR